MLPEDNILRKYYGVHHNPSPHTKIMTMAFHPNIVKRALYKLQGQLSFTFLYFTLFCSTFDSL